MRIVVPYTRLRWEVTEALDAAGYPYTLAAVNGNSGYFELLRDLWAEGETFAVVEHDIVATPAALQSLNRCDGAWCACSYNYVNDMTLAGLGCTKFDGRLLAATPDLMAAVGERFDHKHPKKHWCAMDMWIQVELSERGYRRCDLHPKVQHLMADPSVSSHGCYHFMEAQHG